MPLPALTRYNVTVFPLAVLAVVTAETLGGGVGEIPVELDPADVGTVTPEAVAAAAGAKLGVTLHLNPLPVEPEPVAEQTAAEPTSAPQEPAQ